MRTRGLGDLSHAMLSPFKPCANTLTDSLWSENALRAAVNLQPAVEIHRRLSYFSHPLCSEPALDTSQHA